jgi:hypothetical protein
MPDGARKATGQALQVGKNAITPFVLEPGEGTREKHIVIHEKPSRPHFWNSSRVFLEGFQAVCRADNGVVECRADLPDGGHVAASSHGSPGRLCVTGGRISL